MKFTDSINKLASGLLWLIQMVNLNADVILSFLLANQHSIPMRYKTLVGFVIGCFQLWLAIKAHRVNPDGTPAIVAYRPEDKRIRSERV